MSAMGKFSSVSLERFGPAGVLRSEGWRRAEEGETRPMGLQDCRETARGGRPGVNVGIYAIHGEHWGMVSPVAQIGWDIYTWDAGLFKPPDLVGDSRY